MELETINKLYLELSQIATSKTNREIETEKLLSAYRKKREADGCNGRRWNAREHLEADDLIEILESSNN